MEIKRGRYKTRGGNDAVVLAAGLPVTYSRVVGYVVYVGDGYNYAVAQHWEEDGSAYSSIESEYDLVEYRGGVTMSNEWVENTGTVPEGVGVYTRIEVEYRDGLVTNWDTPRRKDIPEYWLFRKDDCDIIRWRFVK